MNDQKLLELIVHNNDQKALLKLYEVFPSFKALVRKDGGSVQQAEDIFQEALIICIQKWKAPEFVLSSALKTYVYGVAQNVWRNERRKSKHFAVEISANYGEEDTSDDAFAIEAKYEALEKVMMQIGEKCMQLLKWFYYEKKSMTEISKLLGFNSEKSAKTQKYKCMEKARGMAFNLLKQ